jgi:tol-pal system protein YbgF
MRMLTQSLKIRFALGLLLMMSAGLLSGCVSKQAFLDLEERSQKQEKALTQARKDLETIQGEIREQQDAIRADQADIKADMLDLHREIQEMTGQFSSNRHEGVQAARDSNVLEESMVLQMSNIQKEMRSTQDRVARIEDFFGLKKKAASSARRKSAKKAVKTGTPEKTAPAAAPKPSFSAEEAYEAAFRLYKSNQYKNARKAFEAFVRRYPGSSLVDNALFWTGETYYFSGEYENAILQYQTVLEKYPKGSKAPDALLKMGYALEKIGEPKAAVAALEKLLKAYPEASQAGVARRKIQQLKPGKTEAEKDRGNEVEQNPETAAEKNKPPKKEP